MDLLAQLPILVRNKEILDLQHRLHDKDEEARVCETQYVSLSTLYSLPLVPFPSTRTRFPLSMSDVK